MDCQLLRSWDVYFWSIRNSAHYRCFGKSLRLLKEWTEPQSWLEGDMAKRTSKLRRISKYLHHHPRRETCRWQVIVTTLLPNQSLWKPDWAPGSLDSPSWFELWCKVPSLMIEAYRSRMQIRMLCTLPQYLKRLLCLLLLCMLLRPFSMLLSFTKDFSLFCWMFLNDVFCRFRSFK